MKQDRTPSQVWYDQEPDELTGVLEPVHARLFPHVQTLEEDQRDIHLQNVLNSQLYSNRQPMAFSWNEDISAYFRPLNANVENIIQNVVDALCTRMSTNRPKATIVPRGADFNVYLKSKRLDKFLWGEFVGHKLHLKMDRIFRDACIFGTGFLKMDLDGGELFVERVHPDEIVVDQRECVSTDKPLQMHHRKLVSRLWLQKTYGKGDDDKALERRQLIKECQERNFSYTSYRSPGEGQVVLIESWKLPTRPGAGDGRHTICIQNCTLLDEAYDEEDFPFVTIKYAEPDYGYYGRSLVGDLIGYQLRQNELNDVIRLGQELMCVPRILLEQGSDIAVQQLDNRIAKVLKYRGVKPEAVTWNAFNAEIYNERDRNRASAFEFAGISPVVAQQKLPTQTRMDSAEAFREVAASQDERFNTQAQRQEEAYKEAAARLLALNAKLHRSKGKSKPSRSVVCRSEYLVEQIDWASVDMDRDKYVLEISASSIVNMTPAARTDKLENWLDRQLITPEQYKMYSGSPDLERLAQVGGAEHEYIEYMVDALMNVEEVAPVPDPLMNLVEAFSVVHRHYMHLSAIKTPEEVLARFQDWLLIAKDVMAPEPTPQEEMAAQQGVMDPTQMGMDPAMMGMDPAMAEMNAGAPMPMGPGAGQAPMGGMVLQ